MNLKGIKELKQKLRRDVLILPIVSDAVEELTLYGEEQARRGAPRDIGGLQNAITSEVKPLLGRVYVLGSVPRVKVGAIEFGRKPDKKMPPASALQPWAARHGADTTVQALFLIARSISRRGIKGRFFMKKARILVRRKMKGETVEKMAKQAEAIWGR